MSNTREQTEPFYALKRRFVDRIRMRRLRAAGIDYRTATCWYAVMHDLASNARAFGTFSTDVRSFVEACGGPPADLQTTGDDEASVRTWRLFARVGLVELHGDPAEVDEDLGLPAVFRVHVLDVEDVNSARREPKPNAQRQAEWRARQRESGGSDAEAGVTNVTKRVTGVTGVTTGSLRNEDPPTHPIDPMEEDRACAGGPAHEAGPNETSTSSDLTVEQSIAHARRALGPLAEAGDRFVADAVQERRPRQLSNTTLLERYWQPLADRVRVHGVAAVEYALGEAARTGKPGVEYLDSCIATHAKRGPAVGVGDEGKRNRAILDDLARRHPALQGFDGGLTNDTAAGAA